MMPLYIAFLLFARSKLGSSRIKKRKAETASMWRKQDRAPLASAALQGAEGKVTLHVEDTQNVQSI